jgi:predicted kinase
MRRLTVLVGLPRSGKSTWAREQGLPIVCPDAVRLAVHGERFLAKPEPLVWVIVHIMVEALFIAGSNEIIIDATNVNAKSRDQWAKKFPDAVVHFETFLTSPKVCKERALATGQPDLLPVIDRMVSQWDLPKPDDWNET